MTPSMMPSNFGFTIKGLFISLLILFAGALTAQNLQSIDSIQYKITKWGSNDGIPNRLISLYQDKDEYMWIGTFDGLFRFDGTKFSTFNRFNTAGLHSDHIQIVTGDETGNLWIGTGKGLVHYHKGKFTDLAKDHDFFIESLSLDKYNNKLWIGTRHNGLYEYDIKNGVYQKNEIFSNDLIGALALDKSGGVWLGGEKNGLTYLKNSSQTHYGTKDGLGSSEILSVYIDSTEQLYVCTSSGLYLKKKQEEQFFSEKTFDGVRVESAKKDQEGNLWVATAIGVYKQNGDNTWRHFTVKDGLSANEISDINFISEGSIWLATSRGGLNQLRKAKFITIAANQGLAIDGGVGAVQEVAKDIFLVGTTNGKLYSIAHGHAQRFLITTELKQRIHTILKDSKNNLWIGSYDGLLVITPGGKEKLFTEKEGLPTRQIRIIYEDKKNNYWIGTRNKGLLKMEVVASVLNPAFKTFEYDQLNQANSTFIMSIEENSKNELLVGSNTGGLVILSDKKFQHYSKENGLDVTNTLSARYDHEGLIWIATSEGLRLMENDKFFQWTPQEGLPASNIFDVMEDNRGYFWLPSAKGIIRAQRQQLLDFKNKKTNHIDWKLYTSNNELENSDCTAPSQILKSSDGSLWFPMTGGVVAVNTKSITTNKRPPLVYIEKVSINEKEFVGGERLLISAGNQRVVFSYTALCLNYPNSPKYKYQLKPFDKDWNDAGTDRQAIYTSLPGGDYTFRVIACNNDGVWNTTGASILVTKQPYFYQTWWFYSCILILLVFLILIYIRWKTKDSIARAYKLERDVERRTRQLKQKSEALEEQSREKTGMINIVAHDLKAPLNKIKGLMGLMKMTGTFSAEQEEYVNYIDQSILQGDQLIRDLLDVHSFEHEDSKLEIEEIAVVPRLNEWQQAVSAQLREKNQILKSDIELSQETVMTTDRHKFIRVLDNLISNASKFSDKGKEIHFRVWKSGELINLSIRDEGPGISEPDQKKLFKRFQKLSARPTAGENSSGLGLSIIKVLLNKLGGSIRVQSKLGEGTEFIVTLPSTPSPAS